MMAKSNFLGSLLSVMIVLIGFSQAFAQGPLFSITPGKDACGASQATSTNGSFTIHVTDVGDISGSGQSQVSIFGPTASTFNISTTGDYLVSNLKGSGVASNYQVTILDNGGNFTTHFTTVAFWSPPSAAVNTITPVTTCTPFDGAITINPSGGSGSYTYAWTGPSSFTATTQNISGVAGGNYTVTVSDPNTVCTGVLGPINVPVATPSITLGSIPGVCSGTATSTLSYGATTGSPNEYTIDWDNTANLAGLADVTPTALPASPITISGIPSVGATTTFNGTLTGHNTTSDCYTSANPISVTVTVNVTPAVNIVAAPGNTICAGTSVTFTATPTFGGTPSYQWRKNGGNVGTNSNTYTDAGLVNNDKIDVVMTSTVTCVTSPTATSNLITMTVNPLPVAPTGTDVTTCFDGAAHTGSATPGAGESIVWYTAAVAGSVTVAPSGTAAGIYTAFAASKNNTTNCESSTRTQVTVTINALPAAPAAGNVTVCFDGAVHTGSATPGAGESIVWYTAAVAGSVTVAPSGTAVGVYTAFAASKNNTTNCESSTRTQVTVTINALPAAPTGTDVTTCFDGAVHTGSATPGAGESIVWYTAAVAGSVTVAPSGTAVGTYTAFAASKNNTTNCESSTRTQVTVTINALPAAPTGTDVTVCFDGAAHTGSATAGAGESIVWYTAAVAGSVTVAPSGTAVGTYTAFAASKDNTTNCESSTRTQVTVTINALPAAPTGTDVTVCFDGAVHTGNATPGAGESIVWYTAAVAGSVTVAPSGTAVGTYTAFAASKNNTTNCESSTRTQVTVTINAIPAAPTGTDVTVCFDGAVHTGSATPGAGESIVWYTAAVAGSVTTAPSGTTAGIYTAFAASKDNTTNCESSTRTQVTVTINALPAAPTGTDVTVCFDGAVHTGNATPGAGESIVWYTAAVAGSVTVAPSGTAVGTYTAFAASKDNTTNCESSTRTQVTVTINALPAAPTGTDVTACFDGAVHTGSATPGAGESIVWYTAAVAGSVTVAPSGTAVGTYTAFAASKNNTTNCESSTRTQVTVTINALPAAPTGTDVTVCFDGAAHTGSATPGAGESIVWYTAAVAGSVTVVPSGTAVGTYTAFAASKDNTTNCESSTRTQVTVTINALPAAPTGTDVTTCFDGAVHTGSATPGAGESIVWYTAAVAGSVTVAPSGTAVGIYTAFASSKNNTTNCESSTRTQVTVTINALPAAPTGTDVTTCFDGALHTGSATPGAGESIVWYTAAVAGSVTAAPNGTAVGTYTAFAASKNNATNCESSTRTQVTVTINALPTVTITTGAGTICTGSSSTYTTQAGQTNYVWSVTGGTITSGGAATDNTATVQWTTTGSVSVNYKNGSGCTAAAATSKAVTVDATPTVATAGGDQSNVCGTVSLGGNTPTVGTGSWGYAPSGNVDGNGNIVTPTSPTSGFNGTPGKTYTLRWTISNGTCPSTSDDVAIAFDPVGVTPSAAGPDQNNCNSGSFTLAGNSPTSGTGQWSVVGAANGATITSPTLNNSAVTGLALGKSVTLRWSITNGATCTSTDDVVLANNDNPTTAAAGSDQSVCGTSATLAANTPTVGTGSWSITSGTGGSIANAANPASGFTGTQGNSYTLRWTISNGACSPSTDDVTITFDSTPTTAAAGPDILNACGTITLGANNPTTGVGQWSITSNPDNLGSVANPASNVSNFNGTSGVTYVLRWSITNGSCPSSTDDVQIQYNPGGPTTANAGTDQNVCGISTTLSGNNPTVGTGQWSFASGGNPDGLGAFADVNNQTSGFSGTAGQTYKLVWIITSGTCTSTDQVNVQFNATPTTSNAGPDQNICSTSTTLAANAPSTGTGVWSFSSNPDGLGAIADVNNRLSGFSGTAGQVYVLTWTISSGGCAPSTDNIQITVNNVSLTVFNTTYCQNAGPLDLTTLVSATPAGGALTFTGPGVTGSTFDPTGLTGVQTITVKYVQNTCTVTQSLLINVLLPSNPGCGSGSGGGPNPIPFIAKVDACNGNDGQIKFTSVSGGTAPYQYSIDNGTTWQASNTFSSLAGGTYSALVMDAATPSHLSSTFTIVVAYKITGTVTKTDVTTCTATDGKITLSNVQGGSGSYVYSTDGGTTFPFATSPITGLTANSYSIVIKDTGAGGCLSAPTSVAISLPAGCGGPGTNCNAFTINATDTRPTCTGQDDGTITIVISGGSPNYVVTLSDATQGFNQALTGPGPFSFGTGPSGGLSPSFNYTYTVTDNASNTCTLPYSLPIQSNVQANASGFVDAQCYNQAVGQATLTVTSGGTSPFEYSLDAGATWVSFTSPATIKNLMPAASPYSILVRDDASDQCPAQVNVTIGNAANDILITSTTADATCVNNDGSVQVTSVSGGNAPYTYQFNGTATSSLSFGTLAAGNYAFTVNDALGCAKSFPFTISSPGYADFTTQVTNPTCLGGGSDGKIDVQVVTSGNFDIGITTDPNNDPSPFQFLGRSNISTPVTFTGLSQGTYRVVVKPNGALCSTPQTVVISSGPVAVDFNFKAKDFKCFETKGTVQLFNIKGSTSVDYTYEIEDANLGSVIRTGGVNQLQALDTATLPLPLVGLDKGNYRVRLFQDQSASTGCATPISTAYKSFSINGPTLASFDTVSVIRNISQYSLATGSMNVTLDNTFAPKYQWMLKLIVPEITGQDNSHNQFDSQWTAPATSIGPITFDATDLYAGSYQLSIRDSIGCLRTYSLNINLDGQIFIPNIFTPNNDSKNDKFEILYLPPNSNITITNRWGKQVLSGSSFPLAADGLTSVVWDGGTESDGIYYYTLNTPSKTYTGWVELKR